MSIKSVTTNQKFGLVEQKRWNAKARDALCNHQPFHLCYYGALAVIPGLMFIDLSNGFGIDRAGHPVVLSITGLTMVSGLVATFLELRYLFKPAPKEMQEFVQTANLVDKARQILVSRTSKGLPLRGLDVSKILTLQLQEHIA